MDRLRELLALASSYRCKSRPIESCALQFSITDTLQQLFTIGICGALGTDDLLACFVAGNALNWNGMYLEEADKRHDEVNSCLDVLLNFGGFMYIGTIFPWREFHMPEVTGITIGRLFILGFLILVFRRIPAIFMTYRLMPRCVKDWKEALFMGYFGPIGMLMLDQAHVV